jgi:hypothetical protein
MTDKLKAKKYSQSVKNHLNSIGNEEIINLRIGRTPLPSAYSFFLNIISLGDFNKKLSKVTHDELFHLFLEITISNGSKYILEKNEIIQLNKVNRLPHKTQTMDVGHTDETINSLLENTLQRIGESKFFFYQALSTNCQHFINSILESNGLSSSENKFFVSQDNEKSLSHLSSYRRFMNTLTDTASIGNVIKDKVVNTGNHLLHTKNKVLSLFGKNGVFGNPFRKRRKNIHFQ